MGNNLIIDFIPYHMNWWNQVDDIMTSNKYIKDLSFQENSEPPQYAVRKETNEKHKRLRKLEGVFMKHYAPNTCLPLKIIRAWWDLFES